MEKYIKAPLEKEIVKTLRAGDYVYITGTIYTARDAAHKRMDETLREGKELPVPLKDGIVYYMGPSPAREGRVSDPLDQRPQAVWINTHRSY